MAMKRRSRVLLILGVILLVPVLAIVGLGVATFGGLSAIEDGQRIGATVQVVADGYVSMDVIDLGDGHVALIDCGNDRAGVAILRALSARDLGPDDVSAVFITHGHPDHIAACPLFTHATLYALAADVGLAAGTENAHSPVAHLVSAHPTDVHVDHPLADGDTITVGNAEVHVYAVPGHTPGSAAYLVDGVLFVGDSASVASDGTLRGAPWFFTDDTTENVASMHALGARLGSDHAMLTTIVASHTGVLDHGDLLAAIAAM